jgi:predicted NBD/HSP70 family sugar kinase
MDRHARGPRSAGGEDGARHAKHLRALNLQRVLAVAMERPSSFTRSELSEGTGLSAPTVGSLVSELIRLGIVLDRGAGPSSGGRRPSRMEFNARYGYVAGIDLGPTRTRLAIADLRGEPVAHRIVPTPTALGPAALLSRIAAALRVLMKDAQAPPQRLLAVGAGAPGAVDTHRGTVGMAPNLRDWTDVPMRDILQRALGAPVVVENDVNLALLGEHWRGAARGHATCAFVFVGTGIGAAILIDGHLHRGHNYMAGEIAMMYVGAQYIDVEFGSRGCLETLAGVEALAARWPRAGQAEPARRVSQLMESARDGDVEARKAVEDTARLIAMAVANVATVVDPSLIVLGGGLLAQAEPLFDAIRLTAGRILRMAVDIVPSALGQEAPLAGALLVAAREARRQLRHLAQDEPAGAALADQRIRP